MKHLTSILDKVASELEARGLSKLASEVDLVANTMDAHTDEAFIGQLTEALVAEAGKMGVHPQKQLVGTKVKDMVMRLVKMGPDASRVLKSDLQNLLEYCLGDALKEPELALKEMLGTKLRGYLSARHPGRIGENDHYEEPVDLLVGQRDNRNFALRMDR